MVAVATRAARRLSLVGVVALLALLLPWVSSPAKADPALPPVDPAPVMIPASAAGAAVESGEIAVSGTTAAAGTVGAGAVAVDGLVLVGGFAGAFQGTCEVLGVLFHDPDGCSQGLSNILHLRFGSSGDQRPIPPGWALSPSSDVNGNGELINYTYATGSTSVGAVVSCRNTANTKSAALWYQVKYSSSQITGTSAGCGNWSTTSTGSYDTGATFAGYPLSREQGANTFCGGSCPIIEWAKSYAGIVNPSTGVGVSTLPAPVGVYYAPAPEPWSLTYTLTCQSGTATATETSVVHFTPTANGQSPDPSFAKTCPELLAGSHVKSVGVSGGRDTIANPEVNIIYPTYNTGAEASYPLCTTKAPAGGCWLDLQKNGKSCFATGVYCAGWLSNETRWNMTCEWGPYSMPLSDCEKAYGDKFDTEVQQEPNPSPSPSAPPGTGTGTIPSSGANPTTDPVPDYNPDPNPDPDPEPSPDPSDPSNPGGSNCWGSGWSWNPVSWVYVPVKCALSWAFVPRSVPSFGDVPNPIPPGWLPSMPGLTDSNCGPVNIGSLDLGPLYSSTGTTRLFNTCDDPWPQVRAVTYYGVLTLVSISAGFRALHLIMNGLGLGVQADAAFSDMVIRSANE